MSKKRLLLALKFLLSGALIWFLFRNIDLDMAMGRVADMAPAALAVGLGLFLIQVVIAALRWMVALSAIGEPLRFARAYVLFYIGGFFNQTLPSSVGGDVVRVYKAYKEGVSLKGSINGVMLDRIATVVALVLLVAALQPFLVSKVEDEAFRWLIPLLVAGAVGGVVLLMVLDRLPNSLQHWKVVRGLGHLAADTRLLFLRPKRAAVMLAVSVLGHVNISVAAYFLAVSLGIEVTVLDCIILIPPVILVTTLPISIAGWGVREGAMVGAFALVGAPAESALVLSIVFGLSAVVTSLPGGVLFLLEGGSSRELEEAEHAVEDEAAEDAGKAEATDEARR